MPTNLYGFIGILLWFPVSKRNIDVRACRTAADGLSHLFHQSDAERLNLKRTGMNLRIRRKTRRVIFLQHAARNQLCNRQIGQQMKDRIRFLTLVQARMRSPLPSSAGLSVSTMMFS